MQAKAINPYSALGQVHKDALDFIIANLPANPTFDNLNEVVVNSIFAPNPGDEPSDGLVMYAGTILPYAYNSYVNAGLSNDAKYTDKQLIIINQLLQGIKAVPVEAMDEFISSIEE